MSQSAPRADVAATDVDGLAASVRDALAHAVRPRYFVTDGRRKTPAIDFGGRFIARRKIDPTPLRSGWITVALRFRNATRES